MNASPGIALITPFLLAIVLSACPAAGGFSFPADGSVAADAVIGSPAQSDSGVQSSVKTVDESFNGKTVHVASGDTLLVQLNEHNPDQTWHFDGSNGFKVVSDVVLQTYPARHDFRLSVSRPGNLRFTKIDRRDGFVIDTFSVRVVLDEAGSGSTPRRSHPLRMLQSMEPDLYVRSFWR
jgi:hypothetical protein